MYFLTVKNSAGIYTSLGLNSVPPNQPGNARARNSFINQLARYIYIYIKTYTRDNMLFKKN